MTPDFLLQLGINLITLGAFYGATIVEIRWIKKTLEKHDRKFDNVFNKLDNNR